MNDSLPHDLAFTPVPSATGRRDGWTPERQRAFILALSRIGLVTAAAREVGMSRNAAYKLLTRAGPGSGFAKAWDAAIAAGKNNALATGIERALEGVEVPYFYHGLQRGVRRVYDNRLLIAALRATARERGAAS